MEDEVECVQWHGNAREGYSRRRILSIENMVGGTGQKKGKRELFAILDIMQSRKWSDLEDHGPGAHAEEFAPHKSSTGNRCPDLRQKKQN